ncbi:MAG: hypothetical protein KME31_30155 [Tolypothrix carrinoi HA7290-LM1]|jgi:hypothetical protein|nr:hypothetical protein [Tolypothrix carrinoi HA7290-LM1]
MLNLIDLELASYDSWTAFEQIDRQGWILRFADGATKRANSANILTPHHDNLHQAIADCESFFTTRSQPTIFRLFSFVENARLHSMLADAGYCFVDLHLAPGNIDVKTATTYKGKPSLNIE